MLLFPSSGMRSDRILWIGHILQDFYHRRNKGITQFSDLYIKKI